MTEQKQFFLQLFALTAVLGLAFWGLDSFEIVKAHPHTAGILGYNVLLSSVSYFLLKGGMKEGKTALDFNNHFMGNSAIRLLLTAVLILVYYRYIKIELILFTGVFFSCYFIYTIFEIRHMLANLRQNSERLGKTDGK